MCEEWMLGESNFPQIMQAAFDVCPHLNYDLQEMFGMGLEVAPRWAEGISKPHPILQSKVVEYLMGAAR